MKRSRRQWIDGLMILVLALLLGTTLWVSARHTRSTGHGRPDSSVLRRPIRLEKVHPGASEELFLGLRVHHYRPQSQSEATFLDYFYDTADWDLFRLGYSYRFRIRQDGDPRYTVRLEREPRFLAAGEQKLDSRSDLPQSLGAEIEAGNWQQAITGGPGLEAPHHLRTLLSELGIEPSRLQPSLRGELHRARFDVTDKGQSWFELDAEDWSFSLPQIELPTAPVSLRNFVLDTRLSRADPELRRRVQTMLMMSAMFHSTRPTHLAPHEQAIIALVGDRIAP